MRPIPGVVPGKEMKMTTSKTDQFRIHNISGRLFYAADLTKRDMAENPERVSPLFTSRKAAEAWLAGYRAAIAKATEAA